MPSAIAARIARKKVVIISGGYDVANVSEIRYGNMCGALSKHLGRALFRMAYIVAAVSQANAREAQKHAKVPRERLRLIYHGFDCHLGMNAPGNHHREKLVLTVGQIDACTIHRKGLLAIAKVSRMLPDVPFVFAGSFEHEAMLILRRTAGSNVTFTGHVSNGDLHELFTRAKIYLQPSIHEAFGCSVAEAMLYNCIPVVSNRYALPEVVGNSGIYVDPDDLQGMASALKHALNNDIHFPESPRERILRKFPLEQRRKLLLRLLDDVFSGS